MLVSAEGDSTVSTKLTIPCSSSYDRARDSDSPCDGKLHGMCSAHSLKFTSYRHVMHDLAAGGQGMPSSELFGGFCAE